MEILQLFDIDGKKLNKTIERGQKPEEGEFIKLAVVHFKSGDKYMLQLTSEAKGSEYAATGGHVPAGFDSDEQAVVECQEELGITIDKESLNFLGSIKTPRAIFDVYLLEDDSLINKEFALQDEEVEALVWLTVDQIENLILEEELGSGKKVRESTKKQFYQFIKKR